MESTLIDALKGLVTPDLLSRASAAFGESEAGTSKALQAAMPAVLAGMLNKTSDSGAMGMLDGLLKNGANDGSLLSNLGGLLGGGAPSPMQQLGGKFLDGVFGAQLGPVAGAIAQMTGVRSASVSSLLGMAAPIIMSVLGSKMKSSGLGLASLLSGERQSIMSALPSGLSSVLGALPTGALPHVPTPHASRWAVAGWRRPVVPDGADVGPSGDARS
jgi:OmpA-OmpF porin, OOP family